MKYLFIFISALLIVSCKKDNVDLYSVRLPDSSMHVYYCPPGLTNSDTQKIKSIYQSGIDIRKPPFLIYQFEYNERNMLSEFYTYRWHYNTKPYPDYIDYWTYCFDLLEFKYVDNRIYKISGFSVNNYITIEDFNNLELSERNYHLYRYDLIEYNNGLPDRFENYNRDGELTGSSDLIYDSGCRLIEISYNHYEIYTYNNNNVTKVIWYSDKNQDKTIEYEFEYDNKKNPLYNLGVLFYYKNHYYHPNTLNYEFLSINNLTKFIQKDNVGNIDKSLSCYYEYDDSGFPVWRKQVWNYYEFDLTYSDTLFYYYIITDN